MSAWPERVDYDAVVRKLFDAFAARGLDGRIVGSYATDALVVPFSDVDACVRAAPGRGAATWDLTLELARTAGDALYAGADPFSAQGAITADYAEGVRVDFFVVEVDGGAERAVWRGLAPARDERLGRAWSALLSLLSAALRGQRNVGAAELAQHWRWLADAGFDVSRLPHAAPSARDDLPELIRRTSALLPAHPLSAVLSARLASPPSG